MDAPYYKDWTKATGDAAVQLTAITGSPGNLWPYPLSALPGSIGANMPKLEQGFITGYVESKSIPVGLEAIGELLVTRAHEVLESGKAYVYLVGVDEQANAYFKGPFKPYPDHYYDKAAGVPTDKLFGKTGG